MPRCISPTKANPWLAKDGASKKYGEKLDYQRIPGKYLQSTTTCVLGWAKDSDQHLSVESIA